MPSAKRTMALLFTIIAVGYSLLPVAMFAYYAQTEYIGLVFLFCTVPCALGFIASRLLTETETKEDELLKDYSWRKKK